MYLKELKARQFKNFGEKDLQFSSKLNAFVGQNGKGKTNILDAIHYLALSKSYLNHSDAMNIQFDCDFFTLEGTFDKNDKEDIIFCLVRAGQPKQLKRNSKSYDRISEHIGQYPLVMISPYDSDLIKEGSDVRRKFLDNIISQSNKQYLADLIRYNKVLLQRNTLLKYFAANQTFDASTLEIYDIELVHLGNRIHEIRKDFVKNFLNAFLKYYEAISEGSEKVNIEYVSQLNETDFETLLKDSIYKDRSAQYSTAGIHKDDLLFTITNYPIKKFGSQGQQKSYLIALKLAQLEVIKSALNVTPILLLDDIFDKLDEHRVTQLVKLVNEEHFGQIFITDTHSDRTEDIIKQINSESKVFRL
ncbi:DNA replication/repair protein RecF [Faecalibacter rhinopitheci]|uniref:DNA replication and repair protein RecF n=1 Tax=Faecalibacter rhinopitheci TaxID=2779678 RepID=A0A8J7G5G0_9FLAO|nr:DNA replication and repair protein RecF [Faecalibacter rhinopitheci]MBF0596987.1 DNA replication and repair protein RecF [Faecalibacter rhinopitheci]